MHRIARAVIEQAAHFQLIEFEQVEATPDTALLRLAGRPPEQMPSGTLTLVIDDGIEEHRHQQLPALPGPPGLVRAAFSVPVESVTQSATYSLALPSGEPVRLPVPARRPAPGPSVSPDAAATSPVSGPATEESAGESSRLVEAERRAESRRLALTELERRLQRERERRSAAESDVAYLRAERDAALAERDEALVERDEATADRDQAEARARAAAANAGTLEAQIRAATDTTTRAHAALEAQLANRAAELERMRTAAEVAQARAHASRREATALDEQLAHAQAQITVLQQALAEREAESASVAAAMDEAVAAAREETAAAHDRAAALGEELEALRDLVSRSDGRHSYAVESLHNRLDVAQSEVELLREAVRAEGEKRIRAEEALIAASAQHALTTESLMLATGHQGA